MSIFKIDVISPNSVGDCLDLLMEGKDSSYRFIAGGTDAVVRMKDNIWHPDKWINIKNIKTLRHIREEDDGIHIGPLTTYTDIIHSSLLRKKADLLVEASKQVGAIQLQNLGTIGGNIGTASPAGDTIPVLYVLDAQIELQSAMNKRRVAVEDYFISPGETIRQSDEMITNIIIQPQAENEIGVFEKLGPRKAQSISIVNCAINIKMVDDSNKCLEGKIAFGSVGPTIIRDTTFEERLNDTNLDIKTIETISAAAQKVVKPISDIRASAYYRKNMASSLLKRGLYQLLKRWELR